MKNPIPFGKYLLLDRINVGGMAEVFFAKVFGEEGGERIIAVKKILPTMVEDEEFISMFIDEARIAVQLDHPNIVQIFELGKHEENYYIAMEYVPGRDLRATLDRAKKRKEQIAIDIAVYIASELAHGLDYAHRAKDHEGNDLHIVHRDVSPQNILISYDGQIKLIDFGIAKAATRNQKTQAGILKGKFGYMSPEQVRGLPIDRRSDIFALGVIFYEMLTGERLFIGDSDFSVLERVRNAEVIPPRQLNSAIPEELDRVVVRALAREPDQRYQWASELRDDLLAFLGHEQSGQGSEVLGGFIRQAFGEEVLREREKMVRFAAVERPAEVPTTALRPFQGTRPPAPVPFIDEHTALVVGTVSQTEEWESPPDTNPMPNPAAGLYPPTFSAEDSGATAITTGSEPLVLPANGRMGPQLSKPPLLRPTQKPTEETRIVDSGSGPRTGAPPRVMPASPTDRVPVAGPSRFARLGIALLALVSVVLATAYFRTVGSAKGMLLITPHPSEGVAIEVDGQDVPADSDGMYVLRGVAAGDHLILAKGPTGDRAMKVTVGESKVTPVDIALPANSPPPAVPAVAAVADGGAAARVESDSGVAPTDAGKDDVAAMPSMDLKDVPSPSDADAAKEKAAEPVQVTIDSDPPDAVISIDDSVVGHAPFVLNANRGKAYAIRAELPGYRTARRHGRFQKSDTITLALSPAPTTAPNPEPPPVAADPAPSHQKRHGPPGSLIISSSQTARVFVDGKNTNRYTPVPPADPLKLSSGRHTIRLQTDDGKKAEKSVNIEADTVNKLLGVEVL